MNRTADTNILQGEDQCLLLSRSQHSLNIHNVLNDPMPGEKGWEEGFLISIL